MQIALRPEQEMFVLEKINQGVYASPDELFTLAFKLLEEYELKKREDKLKQQEIEQVRQKILIGMEDVRQGRVVDGEVVFEQLEENLAQKKQERFALFLSQLPYVSDEEQADIEKCFGSPSDYNRDDYDDYIDATDWLLGRKELKDL